MTSKYKSSIAFGKAQEFRVVSELLKRGFQVFLPVVDDEGVDLLVRNRIGKYIEVQIKARSANAKNSHFFSRLSVKPKDNYYFIFFTEKDENFWIIPSEELEKIAVKNKGAKIKVNILLSCLITEIVKTGENLKNF